jgi:hypothetical protein
MAGKIPVGGTISRAYGFAFGNIVNNLGMIWIPAAILYALVFFFQGRYLQASLDLGSRNPQAILAALPFFFAAMIVVVLILTAQIAALTKEALGLRTGSAFLQFPFGAAMWRLLGSWLLYGLVMIVVYFACLLVNFALIAAIGALARSGSGGATAVAIGVAAVVLTIATFCALIYIAVRLSFLIAPVVVAEDRVSLIRVWELTKGNFWRIFLINLVLLLPFVVLEAIYIYYLYGSNFLPPMGAHVTPDQIAAWSQHQQEMSRLAVQRSTRYWFITYPVGLLVSLIFYGLLSGASAHAYRAVTEAGPLETF